MKIKYSFIALAYDYNEINRILKNTQYHSQLYVIQYQPRYGYNITRTKNMFTVDFTGDISLYNKYYSYYLFKDSALIYAGRFCNDNVLDSIKQSEH